MLYDEIERARRRIEDALIPEVEAVFRRQGEDIERLVRQGDVDFAERLAADPGIAAEVVALVWGVAAPPFASAAYEAIEAEMAVKRVPGRSFWLRAVLAYVEEVAGEMVRAITDTLLGDLRRVLAAGIEEGLGMEPLARRLRDEWPGLTRRRAERIVRTETIAASNWGASEGARRAATDHGLTLEKEWLATPDGRTRDAHRAAHGQRVPLEGRFLLGGGPDTIEDGQPAPVAYEAEYPGDPSLPPGLRINCRCAVAFVPVETKKTWTGRRNAAMRARYEAVKGQYPTWVEAVEDVQATVEGAAALSFETARRICHSKG